MILTFLQRARHRFLWNEIVAQCAFAAALLMGGIVVLLVAGTQILNWPWVVAFSLAGFALALYRTLQRLPSVYKIAILVDSRAALHDALSTAYFFSGPANTGAASPSVKTAQLRHAEALIPQIDLERAVPFHMPRAVYAMGILGLVASSLFALRYGTSKTLDWRPPLTQLVIESLGLKDPDARQAAQKKKNANGKPGDFLDGEGNPLPRSEQKRLEQEQSQSPSNALDSAGEPDPNTQPETASAKGGDGKSEGNDKEGAPSGESEKADTGAPTPSKNASDSPSGSQDGAQQGEQSAGKQQPGNNSSLLSKMKEAMSNLLSKAKPQSTPQGGQQKQNAQTQNGQKSPSQQNGEKNAQSQNQQGDSQDSSGSQQDQQAGDSENAQDSQGKGSGKNSDQQSSSQPGSGIGKQDGAKDVHAAEQKAAMGKLSEIIGKRSANVSGEMMLDVQSGPQQLRTGYSKSSASHAATAGEISRDEVPVALQSYVQQYFEEVRKAERAAPAKAKAPAPVNKSPGN